MKTIVFLIALGVLAQTIFADSSGCASLASDCSEKPCCPYFRVELLFIESVHCFQFGKFCTTYQSISNPKEYFRLLNQLNGTNYEEISQKYWRSLQTTTPPPEPIRWPTRRFRYGRK